MRILDTSSGWSRYQHLQILFILQPRFLNICNYYPRKFFIYFRQLHLIFYEIIHICCILFFSIKILNCRNKIHEKKFHVNGIEQLWEEQLNNVIFIDTLFCQLFNNQTAYHEYCDVVLPLPAPRVGVINTSFLEAVNTHIKNPHLRLTHWLTFRVFILAEVEASRSRQVVWGFVCLFKREMKGHVVASSLGRAHVWGLTAPKWVWNG